MIHTLIGEDAYQPGMRPLLRAPRRPGRHLRGLRGRAWPTPRAATSASSCAGTPRPARPSSRSSASYDPATPGADARGQPDARRPRRASPRSCRSTSRCAWALSARTAAALPLQLEGENEPKGTDRVLELTGAHAALHLPRPRGGARAVAAARLLGPGEARRRLQRRRSRPCCWPTTRTPSPAGTPASAWPARASRGWSRPARAGEPRRPAARHRLRRQSSSAPPRTRPSPPAPCRCPAAAISASRWR